VKLGRIVMNKIFNDTIYRGDLAYDYSGVWTRRTGGIDWKAVVRHADVVCRPCGTLEDEALLDNEVLA
jgi:hypothetical protein